MSKKAQRLMTVAVPAQNGLTRVSFSYDTSRPYAVRLTFLVGAGGFWEFGRDLLREGLLDVAGEGDVIVFPYDEAQTSITLTASEPGQESVTILAKLAEVWAFLSATADLVPYGSETMDLAADFRKISKMLEA